MSHSRDLTTLENGKFLTKASWLYHFIFDRFFDAGEIIDIPPGKALIMTSPEIDGELKTDGEAYIL